MFEKWLTVIRMIIIYICYVKNELLYAAFGLSFSNAVY